MEHFKKKKIIFSDKTFEAIPLVIKEFYDEKKKFSKTVIDKANKLANDEEEETPRYYFF